MARESLRTALHAAGGAEVARFRELRRRLPDRLAATRRRDRPGLVRADWAARSARLEGALEAGPSVRFLHHPAIRWQMFVSSRHALAELRYVAGTTDPATLLAGLSESPVGEPPELLRAPGGAVTSSNTVHHLHHLRRFSAATGIEVRSLSRIVEWGGGYGNLARVTCRLHPGDLTYIIVDLPAFSCLQWLYLASVMGEARARLLGQPSDEIVPGVVNLVPVGLVHRVANDADLFVSTWALNESTDEAVQLVHRRRWFGAQRLLLGVHVGHRLEALAVGDGARSEPVTPSMPGQRYVFR